jgi:predicted peptidase
MKSLSVLLFFCSYAGLCQDLSLYVKKEFTSQDGKKLPYRILFPEHYENGKKYPLILVLHGGGERGSDNEKQLVHGSRLFLDSVNRKNYPAIVVFPQCPQEDYWSTVEIDRTQTPLGLAFDYSRPVTASLSLAMKLVNELITTERIDTKCIYITGLSMGAMGTFEAVYHNPSTFAAALPICGGGDTDRYKKVKTQFWIFHGADDAVVGVDHSRFMVAKLKEERVKVRYSEYPEINHNSWDRAFAEREFLKWMFAKRLRKRG